MLAAQVCLNMDWRRSCDVQGENSALSDTPKCVK